ncbi:1732_t:CDS:2 [Funneliformis geosporum]|nr:1732_t:CDS:2 [Funneliformis geosporum]
MGSEYKFSRQSTNTPGIPDFNCHFMSLLILVIEVKRKYILEDIGEETFSEFYQMSKSKNLVQKIYNYMGRNELRYNQQNYSFTNFKFKSILGKEQSGKMLLCEFNDNLIVLMNVNLSKALSYILEKMQKEVEIYKKLADI